MSLLAPAVADTLDPYEFEVREIVDGVFVATRPVPTRIPVEGNSTFIVTDRDVVVVDAGGSDLSAERLVAAIRQRTGKTVRYLVNTHWHGDHHLGNKVFAAEFPALEIVAQRYTGEDIAGTPMDYLDEQRESVPKSIEQVRALLEAKEDDGGSTLAPEKRRHLEAFVADAPLIVEQLEVFEVVPPTLTFERSLTLTRPNRRIEILYLGRGNTRGDAVVYLPDDRVVITGDLVVMPTPFGFDSYPSDWIETLNALKGLPFDYLVPGHGEVQTDTVYLDTLIELLDEVITQTSQLVGAGAELEGVRSQIDLKEIEAKLTDGNPLLRQLFRAYWVQPITESAFQEATGEPIVQGE